MSDIPRTLCAAFQRTAAIDPQAVALRKPGNERTLTWKEYADQVRQVAAGLASIGIGRGDTIALMMANCIDFYPIEVGAQHVGATSFSVYNTLAPEQLQHVLTNAGCRLIFCEAVYVDRIRNASASLDHIVVIDGYVAGTMTVKELIARGRRDYDFDAGWRAVVPDDVATLIYTSGTTGAPKGVESTHANLMAEAYAFSTVFDIEHGDRITSFMPSAHIADRFTGLYLHEIFGTQITCVEDPQSLAAALVDLRPTIWGAVPRVWEKLKSALEFGVAQEADEEIRRRILSALAVARRRAEVELTGLPMAPELAVEWAEADRTVLSNLRAKIGLDQLRWALSGAAPIPPETLAFFAGLGVPIAEIWGMSELSCVASASHPRETRLGTVGRLLPGMESKIEPDGEFLIRGPLVMRGYRSEPEKTAEAIDPQGWLHTGDIITVDPEGFLRVVDRKKELIINAAGKNMSPANIENTIKASTPLIGAMATIGEGRPYNTALIVLDVDTAASYATLNNLEKSGAKALAENVEVRAEISAGVAQGNQRLSRVEQIKRFIILPTFWEAGGDELTLTQKLRRNVINANYHLEIDALYEREPGASICIAEHPHVATPSARTR